MGCRYDQNTNWELSESVETAVSGPRPVGMQYARLSTCSEKGSLIYIFTGKRQLWLDEDNTRSDPLSTEQFTLNLVWRRYVNTLALLFGIDGHRLKMEYYILPGKTTLDTGLFRVGKFYVNFHGKKLCIMYGNRLHSVQNIWIWAFGIYVLTLEELSLASW